MNSNYCIYNLLKLICLLQDNSTSNNCQNGCDKPFLGPNNSLVYYNTRVLSFYRRDGSLFTITINDNVYSTFRIMNLNNNCCQLLVLDNNNDTYTSTNQYITLNIHCIGAIRCLQDISL